MTLSKFSSSSMARQIQHPSTQTCSLNFGIAEHIGTDDGESIHALVSTPRPNEYRWRVDSASWRLWNLPYSIWSCGESWMLSTPDHSSNLSNDELTSHSQTIFSAVRAASDFDTSDNLCHHTSSQTKARVLMCSHAPNQSLHQLLVFGWDANNKASGSPAGI